MPNSKHKPSKRYRQPHAISKGIFSTDTLAPYYLCFTTLQQVSAGPEAYILRRDCRSWSETPPEEEATA